MYCNTEWYIERVTDDFVENLQKVSADFFANLAAKTVTQAPNFLFSCIVALVAGCYIAKDFKNLYSGVFKMSPNKIFSSEFEIILFSLGTLQPKLQLPKKEE